MVASSNRPKTLDIEGGRYDRNAWYLLVDTRPGILKLFGTLLLQGYGTLI